MKCFLVSTVCLLPLAVHAQSTPDIGVSGGAISLSKMQGGFSGKQDVNGDVSGQHATSQNATRSRTMADRARDVLRPGDFLASGYTIDQLVSGAADAQPAMTAMLGQGAGSIPCGTYQFNSTLTARHSLIGAGMDCVVLKFNTPTSDMIFVPASAVDVQLERFRLWPTAPQTTGAGIHVNGARGTTIRSIDTAAAGAAFKDVILLDNASNTTFISDFNLNSASAACIHIAGAGTSQLVVETHIKDGVLAGCNDGLLVENGSGLYVDNVDALENHNIGFRFAVGNAQLFYGASFNSDYADTNTQGGWDFNCGVSGIAVDCGPINHITLSGDWWSSAAGVSIGSSRLQLARPGLRTNNPQLNGLILSGGTVRANGGHGIELDQGANINIGNTQMFNNNSANSGTYAGLFVNWSVKDLTVSLCRSGGGGVDQTPLQGLGTNHQAYGIIRSVPPTGSPKVNLIVNACNLTGNVVAGSSIGSISGDAVSWTGNIPASPNN